MTSAVPRFTLLVRDDRDSRHLIRECETTQDVVAALNEWLGLPEPRPLPREPLSPAPHGFRGEVWRSVADRPGTAGEVASRFSGHCASSVRGRLSRLTSDGLLTRDAAGVYRAARGAL